MAEAYDEPPNALFRDQMEKYGKQVEEQIAAFNRTLQTDVAAYNKAAYSEGAPTLFAGTPIAVKPAPELQ